MDEIIVTVMIITLTVTFMVSMGICIAVLRDKDERSRR